jgi:hypothetical protein
MWQFLPAALVAANGSYGKVAGGGGYSTEAQQFFDRITDPGSTRKTHYATLIDGLVSDGIWTKLDALWITAADIAGNAVINLKSSSFSMTNHSATFEADRGYTGDGATAYIDTGYNPTTASGNFTTNAGHISAWGRTSRASATEALIGLGNSGTSYRSVLMPRFADFLYCTINSDSGGPQTFSNTSSNGFFVNNRSGLNAVQGYRNGSSLGTEAATSDARAGPNANFALLANNEDGGRIWYTSDQIAAASIGGSLNATEVGNFYTRVQTYMTAVGA